VGTAQAFPTAGADTYDIQLNVSTFGPVPEGVVLAHAEVRSTNGDSCELTVSDTFASTTCEAMFSSDGGFTLFLEAFSGASSD
jgi:hypothetical protein